MPLLMLPSSMRTWMNPEKDDVITRTRPAHPLRESRRRHPRVGAASPAGSFISARSSSLRVTAGSKTVRPFACADMLIRFHHRRADGKHSQNGSSVAGVERYLTFIESVVCFLMSYCFFGRAKNRSVQVAGANITLDAYVS